MPPTVVQGAGEFRALAARHVRDSSLLLQEKCPHGAVYLAGYAVECTLKARLSLTHRIPRWTRTCLDNLGVDAFTHDLHQLARLVGASPGTLKKIQELDWDSQLRYRSTKIAMNDGEKRHLIALQLVKDIDALIGGV